jgi:hypothetical protein
METFSSYFYLDENFILVILSIDTSLLQVSFFVIILGFLAFGIYMFLIFYKTNKNNKKLITNLFTCYGFIKYKFTKFMISIFIFYFFLHVSISMICFLYIVIIVGTKSYIIEMAYLMSDEFVDISLILIFIAYFVVTFESDFYKYLIVCFYKIGNKNIRNSVNLKNYRQRFTSVFQNNNRNKKQNRFSIEKTPIDNTVNTKIENKIPIDVKTLKKNNLKSNENVEIKYIDIELKENVIIKNEPIISNSFEISQLNDSLKNLINNVGVNDKKEENKI